MRRPRHSGLAARATLLPTPHRTTRRSGDAASGRGELRHMTHSAIARRLLPAAALASLIIGACSRAPAPSNVPSTQGTDPALPAPVRPMPGPVSGGTPRGPIAPREALATGLRIADRHRVAAIAERRFTHA